MIELLGDALMRPRFEADEFSKYRDRQIEFIKSAKDSDPSALLSEYGRAALFGAHPYGRPQGGSERSLATITQADVVSYHATNFGADRATLVFAGDLDAKWMKSGAHARPSAAGRKSKAAAPELAPAPRVTGRRVLLIDSPGSVQTYFWLGNVGVDRRYSGRPALDLVNTLYGGRFTSILNTELRIKSGLSYGASSRLRARHGAGRVRHPLVHADREHRQGAGPHARRRSRSSSTTRSSRRCSNRRAPTCSASIRCGSRPRRTGRRRSRTWSSTDSARTTSKATDRRSRRWTWPRPPR